VYLSVVVYHKFTVMLLLHYNGLLILLLLGKLEYYTLQDEFFWIT